VCVCVFILCMSVCVRKSVSMCVCVSVCVSKSVNVSARVRF